MARLSRRTSKRAFACLAVCGAGGIAGLLGGFGAEPIDTSDLSPAEIVAMRFPAVAVPFDDQGDATAAAEPTGYVLASADDRELASLIFNPNPVYPLARQPTAATAPSPPGSPNAASPKALGGSPRSASAVLPAAPTAGELPPQLASAERELPAAALAYAVTDAPERPAGEVQPQGTSIGPAPVKKAPRPASASNTVLNSAQIASIKERLKLTSYQSTLWPPVESALRDISYQPGHDAGHKTAANPRGGTVDPNSAPVQRLKSAAFPLLMSLNEEQKQEVRSMVRLMGLENLASQF
jgi:hypothetical protein